MVMVVTGDRFGIFERTVRHLEADLHKMLSGEGKTQARNYGKKTISLALRKLVDDAHPNDYEKIEHSFYPKGSSVLNVSGERVNSDYDAWADLRKWDQEIEEMLREVRW